MEIRRAAFELCKSVGASAGKKQIADLIDSIRNTSLHYHGHEIHAQAAGYLLMHQKRADFAQEPTSLQLEPLEEDKVKIFAGLHRQITELNKHCVKPLTDALPNCTSEVLSPYNRLDLQPMPEVTEIDIFAKEQTDNLIDAFQSHPHIKIAIDNTNLPLNVLMFPPEHYMENLWRLEEEIKAAGALERPEKFMEIVQREKSNSPRRAFLKHLAAVLSVRASLSVLNQLIYTKFFSDQLPSIDDTNLISFGSYHFSTGGSSVVFQNGGLIFLVETDDIIVLKTNIFGEIETKFCRVEKLDPHIPIIMPGEPRYAELRDIDENLNPYGILFASL